MNNGPALQQVPLDRIVQGRNTRTVFDPAALQELANSIREKGIVQPLVLHREDGSYRIIAGERRFRASKIAGITEVPAVVHEGLSEREIYALTVVENLQRVDIQPLDEARGFEELARLERSIEKTAEVVGRSTDYVRKRLSLLRLPEDLQTLVNTGGLPIEAGAALARLEAQGDMARIARQGLARGWAVVDYRRAVEAVLGDGQEAMFAVEREQDAPSPEAKAAVEKMDRVMEQLERLCSTTWNEREQAVGAAALRGNDLAVKTERVRLIARHLRRLLEALETEATRRELGLPPDSPDLGDLFSTVRNSDGSTAILAKAEPVALLSLAEFAQALGVTKQGASKTLAKLPPQLKFRLGLNGNSGWAIRQEALAWLEKQPRRG